MYAEEGEYSEVRGGSVAFFISLGTEQDAKERKRVKVEGKVAVREKRRGR